MTEATRLLKDTLEYTRDGEWGVSEPTEGHIEMVVIRGTDFEQVRLGDLSAVPRRFVPARKATQKALRPGDVLIETAGGSKGRPTGRTLLLKDSIFESSDLPITCASFARFLRPNRKVVEPGYLFWSLHQSYLSGQIEQYQVQHTGIARFQYSTFAESYEIPIIPLPEQREIARILGTLDDKIELNRQMNQTLGDIARTLFRSWFVDFDPVRAKAEGRQPEGMDAETAALFPDRLVDSELGPIPEGWRPGALSELCTTQYGYTASATDSDTGVKFLRVKDINKTNWIEWSEVPYCEIEASKVAKYALKEGDILVARMADPGKSAIIDAPCSAVFASYLVRLKSADPDWARWIFYFLKSDVYSAYVVGAKSGSVQSNMNARVIVGSQLVIPADSIVRTFDDLVGPIREMINANVEESRTLAEVRDMLLPELLSGRPWESSLGSDSALEATTDG